MNRFSTLEKLAQAKEQEVLKAWEGLGYYSRARNILKTAKLLLKEGFPKTREGWLELPGVGPYTAGAVLSIAGNQPEAILDGNVERVLCRVNRMSRDKAPLWAESTRWITRASRLGIKPRVFNQALMEIGALICTTQKPKCAVCPLKENCEARLKGEIELYPPPKPKKKWIKINESRLCFVSKDQKLLLHHDENGAWRKGLWDFPEKAPQILDGLLKKNVIGTVTTKHVVTNHKITRKTEIVKINQGGQKSLKNQGYKWVTFENIDVPVGSAFRKTLKAIHSLLLVEARSKS